MDSDMKKFLLNFDYLLPRRAWSLMIRSSSSSAKIPRLMSGRK